MSMGTKKIIAILNGWDIQEILTRANKVLADGPFHVIYHSNVINGLYHLTIIIEENENV